LTYYYENATLVAVTAFCHEGDGGDSEPGSGPGGGSTTSTGKVCGSLPKMGTHIPSGTPTPEELSTRQLVSNGINALRKMAYVKDHTHYAFPQTPRVDSKYMGPLPSSGIEGPMAEAFWVGFGSGLSVGIACSHNPFTCVVDSGLAYVALSKEADEMRNVTPVPADPGWQQFNCHR